MNAAAEVKSCSYDFTEQRGKRRSRYPAEPTSNCFPLLACHRIFRKLYNCAMSATNSYELLKDIEKKLKIEYKHRYDIEPYDYQRDKATRAKFALVYKGVFGFGSSTLIVGNELDLDDSVHGIEVIQEYLNSVPRFEGKLRREVRRTKLKEGWWTLLWVDYFTNIDGQEQKIKKLVLESKLSEKHKSEVEGMLLQRENRVLVGWIPPVSEGRAWALATVMSEEAIGETVYPRRMESSLEVGVSLNRAAFDDVERYYTWLNKQ